MRALVTGGAGFLGSHLVERLLKDGYEVLALDNLYTGDRGNLAPFAENPKFSFVEADVTDAKADDFPKVDEIYNLACPASPVHYQHQPVKTALTSIKGSLFALSIARRDGAKMLQASTSEVYGDALVHPQSETYWGNVNPIGIRSCYDEGKRVAETLIADTIREADVDARIVRIFNTYGPRMNEKDGRVVSNFVVQALKSEDITIYGDGSQTRSFQYVDDLVNAFRAYMELPKSRLREWAKSRGLGAPVVNLGNPGEFTILELADAVLKLVPESKSRLVYRPLPGDDPKQRRPDIALARELLGWEPRVPLAEGLAKTVEYFKGKCQ